jgi:hypothetical protein
VEAVELERRTAIYPRIVLSASVSQRFPLADEFIRREDDGIFCLDYIRKMTWASAQTGEAWVANVKKWFDEVVAVVQAALDAHSRGGRLNELAKWMWFAKRFRAAAISQTEELKKFGISADSIPWTW